MIESVNVRSVTFGRKIPLEKWGNAEFILNATVQEGQTVEEVMASLRKIVKAQLDEVRNEEGE